MQKRMNLVVVICGLLVGGALVLLTLVVQLRVPSHEGDWQTVHEVLPRAEIDGDRLTIRNLRNFTYDDDGAVREARYEDRSYDLAALDSLWYGLSHFASYGLAHSFLSFGFADGGYLALSVEARLEKHQTYSPLLGLVSTYELIYVAADERDVIGLRSHVRGEAVLLYETRVPPAKAKELLLVMLATMNEIYDRPRFYNTLLDNCTTNILQHAEQLTRWDLFTDYRVILPGYSDGLAYQLGAIANDVPLASARDRARLDPNGIALNDPSFSRAIRASLSE
jgi:hypothetical protein